MLFNRPPSQGLVNAGNAAAFDLFQALAPTGDNFVFSPASLWVAMAMAWAGARENTERQMAEVLRFPGDRQRSLKDFRAFVGAFQGGSDEDVTLMANSAWCDRKAHLSRTYARQLQKSFLAQLNTADFKGAPAAACRDINAWAKEHSRGRFPKVVESVHPMTVMMLLNLVYFRGRWTLPFDESATEHAPFRMAGGGTEPTPLMRQTGEIAYFENDALQAIELTYKNADIAFLVLLPRDESTPGAGLDALERRLVEGLWSEVVSRLLPREVEIYLPRFSLGATLSCKAGLEGLGLTLPFGQHADFSGVNDGIGDPILISKVTQLARIEVDEEGTVATAVTALEYIGLSLPPEPIVFRADHPFLFALRKQSTGAIFFLGRLMDPATG